MEARPALLDVSFESTRDDFLRYVQHVALTGPFYRAQMRRTRVLLLLVLFLLPVVMTLAFQFDEPPLELAAALVVSALPFWIAGIIVFFAWPAMWRSQLRSMSRRQAAVENQLLLVGPKRYIFDESAVRFSGAYAAGYVRWPAVMRVTSEADMLYLHVSQASAHILPRRAFASDTEFVEAVQLAEKLRSQPEAIPTRA